MRRQPGSWRSPPAASLLAALGRGRRTAGCPRTQARHAQGRPQPAPGDDGPAAGASPEKQLRRLGAAARHRRAAFGGFARCPCFVGTALPASLIRSSLGPCGRLAAGHALILAGPLQGLSAGVLLLLHAKLARRQPAPRQQGHPPCIPRNSALSRRLPLAHACGRAPQKAAACRHCALPPPKAHTPLTPRAIRGEGVYGICLLYGMPVPSAPRSALSAFTCRRKRKKRKLGVMFVKQHFANTRGGAGKEVSVAEPNAPRRPCRGDRTRRGSASPACRR